MDLLALVALIYFFIFIFFLRNNGESELMRCKLLEGQLMLDYREHYNSDIESEKKFGMLS